MAVVLLSGRPGAGKTELASWLAAQAGFVHVDTDTDEAALASLVAAQTPDAANAAFERARNLGPNVVVEWGFRLEYLDRVRLLRDAGFDPWWLDGDEAAARQGYTNRHGDSQQAMAAYWAQVGRIDAAWANLASFYGDHIIRTVSCVAEYMPCGEIASMMSLGASS